MGVGAAGRHRRRPDALRPGRAPAGGKRGATSCCEDAPAGPHHRAEYREFVQEALPAERRGQPPAQRGADARRRTSRPGCASSSSTASAPERSLRRRPEDPHHARPRPPARGRAGRRQLLPIPTARPPSLVAIDNETGEVRAMVGGRDYDSTPFNLATQGQRQPGSSFKPFVLAQALKRGHLARLDRGRRASRLRSCRARTARSTSSSTTTRAPTPAPTLASALTSPTTRSSPRSASRSAPSRIARAGPADGHPHAGLDNPAMTLGGLSRASPPLDMAHAYETFAARRQRVKRHARRGDRRPGRDPRRRRASGGKVLDRRTTRAPSRCSPPSVADAGAAILETVVSVRHRHHARPIHGGFAAGKTGTTENYGDAWFVGFTDRWTIGGLGRLPRRLKSMKTEYNGGPVAGGTFPARSGTTSCVRPTTLDRSTEARASARSPAAAPRKDIPPERSRPPRRPPRRRRRRPGDAAPAPTSRRRPPAAGARHAGGGTTGQPRRRRRSRRPAGRRRRWRRGRRRRRRPRPAGARRRPAHPTQSGAGAGGGRRRHRPRAAGRVSAGGAASAAQRPRRAARSPRRPRPRDAAARRRRRSATAARPPS